MGIINLRAHMVRLSCRAPEPTAFGFQTEHDLFRFPGLRLPIHHVVAD